MKFQGMSYALLLSAAALMGHVPPAAALPAAPAALSSSIERLDALSHVAARRAVRSNSVNVARSRNVNVNRNVTRNRNVNRNVNVNVNRRVVRPVRPWVRHPWFGTVVAGVTIGTIVAATAVPPAPAPNLCWFWADSSNTRGYWDYCTPPR